MEAVSLLAAVAEDLPVLHAGEGVLDAGADPAGLGVVLLLSTQEGTSGPSAVRDDQTGAQEGAVRDDRRPGRRGREVRLPPDVGVGLVARRRAGARDDQTDADIDDDLHVRREPVVAEGGTYGAVADEDAVHDPQALDVGNGPRGGSSAGSGRNRPMKDPWLLSSSGPPAACRAQGAGRRAQLVLRSWPCDPMSSTTTHVRLRMMSFGFRWQE